METLNALGIGFQVALEPTNLVFAAAGVVIGTIVGILPGISPLVAMALLLPLTYTLPPTGSLIMLAGIYYGAFYGDAATSILLNIPGETPGIMTSLEGYPLRLQGRAGPALGISALASFTAGLLGTIALVALALPLSQVALSFGPPEFFALVVLAMTSVGMLSSGALTKGLVSGVFGLLLATIGPDIIIGVPRFHFGRPELLGGIPLAVVAVGLFALGEVFFAIPRMPAKVPGFFKLRELLPSLEDIRFSAIPVLRTTVVGFLVGVLPGTGATVATFLSYALERRWAKRPQLWGGRGAIEGVAVVQAADNAAVSGTFVPALTLGIPGSGSSAILLGAFILYGLQPGPQLFRDHAPLVWGLIASMFIGNLMLLVLNLPLISLFVQMLRVPFPVLGVCTAMLALVGAYAVQASFWDIGVAVAFGMLAFAMRKTGYPRAPLILGLVLGDIGELSFRQSMLLTDYGVQVFAMRPMSALFLAAAVVVLVLPAGRWMRRRMSAV